MCGPAAVPLAIAAAGAAASAGGSYMNAKAENKRTNAGYKASRNQAEAERIRQRAFQQQGDEVMRQAVPAATSPQTLADAIGMREAGVQQVVQPTRNEYAPTPQSTPNVVNSEIDRQSNKSVAKVGRNAQAQGRLLAFGDADSARGRTMNRSGQKLTSINDASRNSAALLPYYQRSAVFNATRAGDGMTFGDALGLGGQAAQMYGGMGAPGASWGAGAGVYGSPTRLTYNQTMGKGGF